MTSADADVAPDYRRTAIAMGVGWLVPGAGHAVLGRYRRAGIFAALIWLSFALGLVHHGSLALRDGKQPFLTTLQIVANVGIGPADMLARLTVYDELAYVFDGRSRARAQTRETYRDRLRHELSIYGTAYLWTAGLMNLLLLFDLWDIGRGRKD